MNWYSRGPLVNVVLMSVAYHLNASPCSSAFDFPVRRVSYSQLLSSLVSVAAENIPPAPVSLGWMHPLELL